MKFFVFAFVTWSIALVALSNIAAHAENNAVDPDLNAISILWTDFKKAHEANDHDRILAAFAPHSQERYATLYSYLDDTSSIPSLWREFTPIQRTADFYRFALIQADPNGDHLYTVLFVNVPELGWRIESM